MRPILSIVLLAANTLASASPTLILEGRTIAGRTVFFPGEPVVVRIECTSCPTEQWQPRWAVLDKTGRSVKSSVRQRVPAGPNHGKRSLEYEIEGLGYGEYELRLSGPNEPTSVSFTVSVGLESQEIRKVYLRHKADEELKVGDSAAFERFANTMMTIAVIEPDNPRIFERLGDVALDFGKFVDASRYYDQAAAITKAQIEKDFGSVEAAPKSAQDQLGTYHRLIEAIDTINKLRRDGKKRLSIIGVTVGTVKRYAIFDTQTKSIVEFLK